MKRHPLTALDLWAFGFALLALAMPKVAVVGDVLRVDDVLLAIVAVCVGLGYLSGRINAALATPAWLMILIVLWSVCASAVATLRGDADPRTWMFALRPLEYLMGYFLGSHIARRHPAWIAHLCVGYLVSLLAFSVLEKTGLFSTSRFGTSRLSANTGGPYELAAVSAILFCVFIAGRRHLSAAAASVLLVLSASRITAVALGLVLLLRMPQVPRYALWSAAVALVIAAGWLVLKPGQGTQSARGAGLIARVEQILTGDVSADMRHVSQAVRAPRSRQEFIAMRYEDARLPQLVARAEDNSAGYRAFTWTALVLLTTSSFDRLMLGNGPGVASLAVDGFYVRTLAEVGVIGLLLLAWWGWAVLRARYLSEGLRMAFLVLAVTALFIDIFVASKVMLLFWILFGADQRLRNSTSRATARAPAGALLEGRSAPGLI